MKTIKDVIKSNNKEIIQSIIFFAALGLLFYAAAIIQSVMNKL